MGRLNVVEAVAILAGILFFGIWLLPGLVPPKKPDSLKSRSNLKSIGRALYSYHDTYEAFPPGGIFDSRERAFFGWPVSLMPYMASGPEFSMIDFRVPWNDARNAEVFRRPYPWYLNPSISQTTDSQGFVLTHYAANENLMFGNSSMSLKQITDGSPQTILAGEIAEGFLPYAQPGNWRDPATGINSGPNSFGRPAHDGAFMLFADGSVRFVSNKTDPKILRALSTPAGGEDIATDWR